MGKSLSHKELRFKEHDVVVIGGRAALITKIGNDEDRDPPTSYSSIHYSFIKSDGTLEGGFGHWRGEYSVPEDVKIVDFAKVQTVVTLPPEWAERALDYEREKKAKDSAKDEKSGDWEPETHPSYGFMQVSRTSGHTALFGSPFRHMHYMTLTVGRAERHRGLANDRHFGGVRGDLVSVALSEAQWARLLSSVGSGEGVPCTIQRIGGKMMESCPEQMEVERFHEDIERDAKQAMKFMEESLAAAKALLEDKAPSKEKRKALVDQLYQAQKKMVDSVPFVAKQLHERMDTVIQEGKTEIEAFAQRTLINAGLQKLAELNEGASAVIDMPKALKSGGEKP